MKLVFASDSFKGTLSSKRTAVLLEEAAQKVFGDCCCVSVPVADGGEGTTEAVVAARGGRLVQTRVSGPLNEPVTASYGHLSNEEAVLEMAAASGLTLVPPEKRNPCYTTTYGSGEMVRKALDAGHTDIFLAIGGSATNDGGMGFSRALGVRFLDEAEKELKGCGCDLEKVAKIDLSGIPDDVRRACFTVMCDVRNPLCGKNGATYTYGPQKGGTPDDLERLERGMQNYRDVMIRTCGVDPDLIPGSGAAGGLGTALAVFFHARMQSGIETVLKLVRFDDLIRGADLIVTGEGRTDKQSCFGKVLCGVGKHARACGIPAVALCGSLGDGYEGIFEQGIQSIMTTVDAPMPLEEAMQRAEELYKKGAVRLFRMIKAGNHRLPSNHRYPELFENVSIPTGYRTS